MAKRYTARFEHDEGSWWTVTVPEVAGVVTQARTLKQGMERAREALAAAIGEEAAGRAELKPDVVLPLKTRRALEERLAHLRAEKQAADAVQSLSRRIAAELEAIGLSRRDSAELLGMSFQRVQQLVEERKHTRSH